MTLLPLKNYYLLSSVIFGIIAVLSFVLAGSTALTMSLYAIAFVFSLACLLVLPKIKDRKLIRILTIALILLNLTISFVPRFNGYSVLTYVVLFLVLLNMVGLFFTDLKNI
jgi:hypothetical protein